MNPVTTTFRQLEARASDRDKRAIEQRLDAFRARMPDSAARLLVQPQQSLQPTDLIIPEIPAEALSASTLQTALLAHGSLIVRGLFQPDALAPLLPVIDHVLASCNDFKAGRPPENRTYFDPPENLVEILPRGERELGNTRSFHRESGSAMCIEAPSVAECLLELYESRGLKSLLAHYFGQPACLSAKKWVLRRSRLPVAEAGWHQDGAFMGTDINSVNLWLPLNSCGGSTGSPGLDVLPQRLATIVSAEGAQFDWSVSTAQVTRDRGETAITSPQFNAGDAYFFDHFLLHRTQFGKHFHTPRYAIETWFFAADRFPKNQIPLAW